MGNSCGGLKEYMDIFESEPMAQGGCIWDWVDQSFREVDANGKWYWTYGGDYGPEGIPSFGNFCCNGLIGADRTPNPHLVEVKKMYQYIKSTLVDSSNLTIQVKNWYDFSNLSDFTLHWSVTDNKGQVLAEGTKTVACAPQQTVDVTLGAVKLPASSKEAYLNLSWTPNNASAFINTNDEVSYDQFVLPINNNKAWYTASSKAKTSFEVNPSTGAIDALMVNGQNILATPITLSLFRPATDNDNRDRNGARLWRQAGLDDLTQRVVSINKGRNTTTAQVEIVNGKDIKVGDAIFTYSLNKGQLAVETTFTPDTAVVKSMARLGLTFEMNDSFDNVSYLGRGDNETYVDRNQSGTIAVYETTPERMFHYYVTPQSTGNRTDTRWMQLTDSKGEGIFVESTRPFQFSVVPFTDENLEKSRHINELSRKGTYTVHLDAEQAGVGTATCGPGVLNQYLVSLDKQTFKFIINLLY